MEIGSEFNLSLDHLSIEEDNLFEYIKKDNYVLLDSGRSAIKSIPVKKGSTVLLPEYICESVINCFLSNKIEFYKVNQDFTIDIGDLKNKLSENVKIVFFAHYYGEVQPRKIIDELRKLTKERNILLIEDGTQSFFSIKEWVGDYAIASIRKWLPLPMGGILFVPSAQEKEKIILETNQSTNHIRAKAMFLKDLFLKKEMNCNLIYRKIFEEYEKKLDNTQEIYRISDFTHFIISCLNIPDMKKIRKQNYEYLKAELAKLEINPAIQLQQQDCPFTLPIRVKDRDDFRQYLIHNKIYCAVHWPFDGVKAKAREIAEFNANTLISLPIDQRYGIEEMKYMVEIIKEYGGDLLF